MKPNASWTIPGSLKLGATCAAALILLCAAACGERNGSPDQSGVDPVESAVTRTAEAGPVALTLSATPGELNLSQRTVVRLAVVAEKGVTVHVDDYSSALRDSEGQFDHRIVGSAKQAATPLGDGKLRWNYTFELEFALAGEYELPPAVVTFVDERPDSNDQDPDGTVLITPNVQTLETEPLTIAVHDEAGQPLSPEDLHTLTTLAPVDLPRKWAWGWVMIPVIGLIIVVVVVWFARRGRTERPERIMVIPAHEWARRELAMLIADDLVRKSRVQEFYYRISDIVRGYVERRFAVSAPEMTTEEFLTATAADQRFGETNTSELERFLTACDLVKYARQQPGSDESDHLINATGRFVERTREPGERSDGRPVASPPIEEHVA